MRTNRCQDTFCTTASLRISEVNFTSTEKVIHCQKILYKIEFRFSCKECEHWIMATTINCIQLSKGVWFIISVFGQGINTIFVETLFQDDEIDSQIKMIQCHKQMRAKDYGVFTITFATAVAHGLISTSKP